MNKSPILTIYRQIFSFLGRLIILAGLLAALAGFTASMSQPISSFGPTLPIGPLDVPLPTGFFGGVFAFGVILLISLLISGIFLIAAEVIRVYLMIENHLDMMRDNQQRIASVDHPDVIWAWSPEMQDGEGFIAKFSRYILPMFNQSAPTPRESAPPSSAVPPRRQTGPLRPPQAQPRQTGPLRERAEGGVRPSSQQTAEAPSRQRKTGPLRESAARPPSESPRRQAGSARERAEKSVEARPAAPKERSSYAPPMPEEVDEAKQTASPAPGSFFAAQEPDFSQGPFSVEAKRQTSQMEVIRTGMLDPANVTFRARVKVPRAEVKETPGGSKIGTLREGTEFRIYTRTDDFLWVKIRTKQGDGWLRAEDLAVNGDVSMLVVE